MAKITYGRYEFEYKGANMKELKPKHTASDFRPLIGFALVATSDIPGDGTYFTMRNGCGVEIETLYDGRDIYVTDPYGIDADGNRI